MMIQRALGKNATVPAAVQSALQPPGAADGRRARHADPREVARRGVKGKTTRVRDPIRRLVRGIIWNEANGKIPVRGRWSALRTLVLVFFPLA